MMLATTAVILLWQITYGNAYDEYSAHCGREFLTMSMVSRKLPYNFIVSDSLKCINLKSGQIEYMEEGAFDGVQNLTYLNLARNSIQPYNLFSFGRIPNVKALILDNQNYYSYDSTMPINSVYPKLQYLNLRNNKITSIINNTLNTFPRLKRLDISGNRFSSFKFLQTWANTLVHLQLDNSQISDISFSNLMKLETLTLESNNIKHIGHEYYNNLDLVGMKKLKYLSVANNQIESIDELAFVETVQLRYLDLSNNPLPSGHLNPKIFACLASLDVLVLNDNAFEEVPFATPSNITSLWMNCNKLVNLTENSFSMVPYLRTLSLAGNKIWKIHMHAFNPLRVLEKLYLNDNGLDYLPGFWTRTMKNLRYLDLSGNKLTQLDSLFGIHNYFLQELRLDGNPLENIKMDSLATLSSNLTIYLNFGKSRPTNICVR